VSRVPTELNTVGDHIRRKRLGLKMLQRKVAEQLGVDKTSVFNWEANASSPEIRYMPAIIGFLGYNPLPAVKTLAEQLVRHRTTLGLSQTEAAERLGVDPSTLARWERGERAPTGAFFDIVKRILVADKRPQERMQRAG
jgi:transcriptional regulator with XRE-family HTH domain